MVKDSIIICFFIKLAEVWQNSKTASVLRSIGAFLANAARGSILGRVFSGKSADDYAETSVFYSALSAVWRFIYGIFKKKYDRFVSGYVQQKTDVETNPNNELLIKKVAEKKEIIENLDYVVAAIPVAIAITILRAFQGAIEQLMVLLEILIMSLGGKVALHFVSVELAKRGMLNKIQRGDQQ